jgi:hypothetical protein
MGAETLAKRGMKVKTADYKIPVTVDDLKNSRQQFDHAPSEMIFLQLDFPLNGDV